MIHNFQRKGLHMSVLGEVIQTSAAVAAVFLGYIALSQKRRAEAKIIAVRWVSYIIALVIGGSSVLNIYKFGTSTEPVTRLEILWLLLNLWNAIAYLGCGLALALIWRKVDNKAKIEQNLEQK
jgi:hypothetical protein